MNTNHGFTQETILKRRARAQEALDALLDHESRVAIWCGDPIQKPGGWDQTYSFLPHPLYFWLTGLRRASGVLLYDRTLGWSHFVRPVSRDEKVWEGEEDFDLKSIDAKPVQELSGFLSQNQRSSTFHLGQSRETASSKKAQEIWFALEMVRRVKDLDEVRLIERVAKIASYGYSRLKQAVRPGLTERELQVEYEAEVLRRGASGLPYETIIGSAENSAVLHAIPTSRVLGDNEIVLVDAGAEIDDYCVDITRVYSSSGRFTSQQQELYEVVLQAQERAIASVRPGTEWHEVHAVSARVIAEGLKSWGLMRGSVDGILESGAISVFFPHGVGHLVGLRVRDTGCPENVTPQKRYGVTLRVDLKLRENFLLTVEPGCYFIAALINEKETRERFLEFINFEEASKWLRVGGVRIEDDVLVTDGPAKNLTALIPK